LNYTQTNKFLTDYYSEELKRIYNRELVITLENMPNVMSKY